MELERFYSDTALRLAGEPTDYAGESDGSAEDPWAGTLRPSHALLKKAGLKTTGTASQQRRRVGALWPGSRFTEADRARAIYRGMNFIYRTARQRRNFAEYGHDYLWCFYSIGASVADPRLRQMTRRMGVGLARQWRRDHSFVPQYPDAGSIINLVFGSDAADGLGVRDEAIKEQLRRAAARYRARTFLSFDPVTEPPPVDVPDECQYCHVSSARGSKTCRLCQRPLVMRTRYDVWYDALITTYTGEHYGVMLGARYVDVLKWLPTLRPYRGSEDGTNTEFYDTVYAITHVVYTLNNYSLYRLSPRWLPQEFEFLKTNLQEAIAQKDADMLGEFMDSLKAFGLTRDDPRIRAGTEYLLSHQNPDGSWGRVKEKDIYDRYHPTWNAIAGLSEYAWQGERLSFPEVKPLLERWADEGPASGQSYPLEYPWRIPDMIIKP